MICGDLYCSVFFSHTVWFTVLMLVYLDFSVRVGTVPICAYGPAGCKVLSLADLFERVIQQSSRMHGMSSDLHSEFVRFFFVFTIHHPFVCSHHQSPTFELTLNWVGFSLFPF